MPQVDSEIFPVVWFLLKSMLVAGYFLYFKYASETPLALDNPLVIATMALIIASTCLAKYWVPLYFQWRQYGTAAALAFVLWACAVVILILIAVERVGGLWFIPLIMVILHVVWLTIAFYLNVQRVRHENKHKSSKSGYHKV
jgi:tryptophan-rich sensory protein